MQGEDGDMHPLPPPESESLENIIEIEDLVFCFFLGDANMVQNSKIFQHPPPPKTPGSVTAIFKPL